MAAIEKRVNTKGKESYRVKVRLKGHPAISGTFKTRKDAEKFAKNSEKIIRKIRTYRKLISISDGFKDTP